MATAILEKSLSIVGRKNRVGVDKKVFGDKVGFVAKLFGCWHENVSRPFVEGHTAYRSCLNCGARKQFDSKTLQTHGKFYYPPLVRRIENL